MSELEERFEKWWQEESTRFFAGHEVDGWMHTACKAAWMNGADVQKHSQEEKDDALHLFWIYYRLVNTHNENPHVDYMMRLEKIAGKTIRHNTKEQG
jgi:hypothetical protein